MRTVLVTGAAGTLGRRVVDRLAGRDDVDQVLALDTAADATPTPPIVSLTGAGTTVRWMTVALDREPLADLLATVSVVVHLGAAAIEEAPAPGDAEREVLGARRLLEAMGKMTVERLVVVSSATVYGAWPANPVPLTEDAAVKPNPGFSPAQALAETERLVAEWRGVYPSSSSVVLRPVTTVAPDRPGWLARALRAALAFPVDGRDPATQFLHLEDLVAAVDLAVAAQLAPVPEAAPPSGVFNVAPDGWVSGTDRRALDVRPTVRLPEAWARKLAGWRWRLGVSPTPPPLLPYATHPWVVANDRLRATGWVPLHSNEEAWVDAHHGGPLELLSPSRRQELILLAVGGGAALAAAGTVAAFRHRRRRPRPTA